MFHGIDVVNELYEANDLNYQNKPKGPIKWANVRSCVTKFSMLSLLMAKFTTILIDELTK